MVRVAHLTARAVPDATAVPHGLRQERAGSILCSGGFMSKTLRIIAALSVAIVVSGCAFLFPPAVTGSVSVDDNNGSNLSSVTITVGSTGGAVPGLDYELQLANGTSLSASNAVLYAGTIDVPAGSTETATITRAQIDAYMTAQGEVQNSPGGYYILLHLDQNDRQPEIFADFLDQQAESNGQYQWVP